jgi:phage/plasmid primase-like uncharacterized protein
MAERLGLEFKRLGPGVQARCVWHVENHPSMSIRLGADGTLAAKCFSCGKAGNVFHLVAQVHSLDIRRDFAKVVAITAGLVGAAAGQAPGNSGEWDRARRKRDAALVAGYSDAADRAARIWREATPVDVHPYLKRKGIGPNGARQDCGHLVIPFVDLDGKVWTLERIHVDGTKRFLAGGRLSGNFALVGFKGTAPETIAIGEGWATACSVFEATGIPTVAAGSSTNLVAVCQVIRSAYAGRMLISADDDSPGRTAAEAAALEVGGTVVLPCFGDNRPEGAKDWNDLHQLAGLDAVRAQFEAALR